MWVCPALFTPIEHTTISFLFFFFFLYVAKKNRTGKGHKQIQCRYDTQYSKGVDLQNANVHLGRSDGDDSSGGLLLSCTGDSKDENFAIYIQNIALRPHRFSMKMEFSLPWFLKVVYIEGITNKRG